MSDNAQYPQAETYKDTAKIMSGFTVVFLMFCALPHLTDLQSFIRYISIPNLVFYYST
jgi:hypothetical protein